MAGVRYEFLGKDMFMWGTDYQKIGKIYGYALAVFLLLVSLLGVKIWGTCKVYGQYQEAQALFTETQYIEAQQIYQQIQKNSQFHFFTAQVHTMLKNGYMVFITNERQLLQQLQREFEEAAKYQSGQEMLHIYTTFLQEESRIRNAGDLQKRKLFGDLAAEYKIQSLFAKEFGGLRRDLQTRVEQAVENQDFQSEHIFMNYLAIPEVYFEADKTEEIQEAARRYYEAKLQWVIGSSDLVRILSESTQMIEETKGLIDQKWVIQLATDYVSSRMKDAVQKEDYEEYERYGSRYMSFLSALPTALRETTAIADMLNKQVEQDLKKAQQYTSQKKYEQALAQYQRIGQYIVLTYQKQLNLHDLKVEVERQWTENEPIRMFGDKAVQLIAQGKNRWGKNAYILAMDPNENILYWGEMQGGTDPIVIQYPLGQQEIQQIYIAQTPDAELPLIMVESSGELRKTMYQGYKVMENKLEPVLQVEADALEIQGKGLVISNPEEGGIRYDEWMDQRYQHMFTLKDVQVYNTNHYGGILSDYGNNVFPKGEVRYITFETSIQKAESYRGTVKGMLKVNYIDPNGTIVFHEDSYGNATWVIPVDTKEEQHLMQGLGSYEEDSYIAGVYRIEFWWNETKLRTDGFEIIE